MLLSYGYVEINDKIELASTHHFSQKFALKCFSALNDIGVIVC